MFISHIIYIIFAVFIFIQCNAQISPDNKATRIFIISFSLSFVTGELNITFSSDLTNANLTFLNVSEIQISNNEVVTGVYNVNQSRYRLTGGDFNIVDRILVISVLIYELKYLIEHPAIANDELSTYVIIGPDFLRNIDNLVVPIERGIRVDLFEKPRYNLGFDLEGARFDCIGLDTYRIAAYFVISFTDVRLFPSRVRVYFYPYCCVNTTYDLSTKTLRHANQSDRDIYNSSEVIGDGFGGYLLDVDVNILTADFEFNIGIEIEPIGAYENIGPQEMLTLYYSPSTDTKYIETIIDYVFNDNYMYLTVDVGMNSTNICNRGIINSTKCFEEGKHDFCHCRLLTTARTGQVIIFNSSYIPIAKYSLSAVYSHENRKYYGFGPSTFISASDSFVNNETYHIQIQVEGFNLLYSFDYYNLTHKLMHGDYYNQTIPTSVYCSHCDGALTNIFKIEPMFERTPCNLVITSVWIKEDLQEFMANNNNNNANSNMSYYLFNPAVYLTDKYNDYLYFTRNINLTRTIQSYRDYIKSSSVTFIVIRYCPGNYLKISETNFRTPFIAPSIHQAQIETTATKDTVLLQAPNHYFCNSYAYEKDILDKLTIWVKLEFNNPYKGSLTSAHLLETDELQIMECKINIKNNLPLPLFPSILCSNFTGSLKDDICYSVTIIIYDKLANVNIAYIDGIKVQSQSRDDSSNVPPIFNHDFGIEHGDKKLIKQRDVCSERIVFPTVLPFGLEHYKFGYVSSNGMISFETCLAGRNPSTRFPTEDLESLIAPFWADFDSSYTGEVFYGIKDELSILDKIRGVLRTQNIFDFIPRWVLVVTYDRVPEAPANNIVFEKCAVVGRNYSSACNETNSFQILITTNKELNCSYVIIQYKCSYLNWPGKRNDTTIGFNGKGIFSFDEINSKSAKSNMIACPPNEDEHIRIYKLTSEETKSSRSELISKCSRAITNNNSKLIDAEANNIIGICPCNLIQAIIDRRFRIIDDETDKYICLERTRPHFRCCYKRSNGVLFPYLSIPLKYSITDTNYNDESVDTALSCRFDDTLQRDFTTFRPSINCNNYTRPAPIRTFGDPHFISLDKREFTFNGHGEYIFLESFDVTPDFVFQGRTRPLVGAESATVLSALAIEYIGINNNSVNVQFEINLARPNIPIDITIRNYSDYTVGINISDSFVNDGDTWSSNGFTIRQNASKFIVELEQTGEFTIGVNNSVMDYLLYLDDAYKEHTIGLMGRWNDDPIDDLFPRNGQFFLFEPSDEEIHGFGQSWKVYNNESLFIYPIGTDTSNFSDPNYVPAYSDGMQYSPEVMAMCDTQQCMFDLAITNNSDLATNTEQQNIDFFEEVELLENNSPFVNLPEFITSDLTLYLNQTFYFTVTVSDDKPDFTFTASSNLQIVQTLLLSDESLVKTYNVTITPIDPSNSFYLSLSATDSNGATNDLDFTIILCGCQMGDCIDGLFSFINYEHNFRVQMCDCNNGYDGTYCENDLDGCTNVECYPGVTCIDLPPPSISGLCGDCPLGTYGNGLNCEDINECFEENNTTNDCNFDVELCINTIGSFYCVCVYGYYVPFGGEDCEDLDECNTGPNPCQQMCNNYDGGYNCSCANGFVLNGSKCESTTPCSLNCGPNGQCGVDQISGEEYCYCDQGYIDNSNFCEDIDECEISQPCNHLCSNTNGGYECSCRSGFNLHANLVLCVDIDECDDPNTNPCNIGQNCVNNLGGFICSSSIIHFSSILVVLLAILIQLFI